MEKNREIPWHRIFAEGAAIIVSILLAFAIQAWWDNQQDREAEENALRNLRNDFVATRTELADRIGSLEYARHQFQEFQSTSLEDLERLPQLAAEEMLAALSTASTFDPFLGTLDAMAADGRLALVRDINVRDLLSKWTHTVNDLEEEKEVIYSSGIRVWSMTESRGGPFFGSFVGQSGPPASEIFPRADGSTVAQLRQDNSFVSTARAHQYIISIYLIELNNAANLLNELIRVVGQKPKRPDQ